MSDDRPVLADKLYIPKHMLRGLLLESIQQQYTYVVEKDEVPEAIKNYGATRRYHTFPRGNLDKLNFFFDSLKPWRDKRRSVEMDFKLEFVSSLYAEQRKCVNEWLSRKHGILVAPTAWGKTVAVLSILCNLNQRTLILVSKTGHARTWLEETYKHTNAEVLDRMHGKPMCGIFDTKSRTVYPCLTIATYQSFIHGRSAKWYDDNRHHWGAIWVDECDEAGAEVYSQVVGASRAKIRGGCTATPNRNDGLDDLVYDILGTVTSRGVKPTMNAIVTMVDTGVYVPSFYGSRNAQWVKALSHVISSEDYYKIVKRMIVHDVDAGRYVLVASDRNQILFDLFSDLNDMDFLNGRVATLTGATKDEARDDLIARARSGQLKVTLAQAKICNRNLNVPKWDCLHRITPCAGWTRGKKKRPNTQLTQPLGRVVRHMRDSDGNIISKPTPVVRHYTFNGNPVIVGVGKSCASAYAHLDHVVIKRVYGEVLAFGDETIDLRTTWDDGS